MHAGKQAKDTDSQAGRQAHGQALVTNKKKESKQLLFFFYFVFRLLYFVLLGKTAVAGHCRSLRFWAFFEICAIFAFLTIIAI